MSSEPGVRYAPLYYKSLEIEKDKHLKINCGNLEAKITISDSSKETVKWWINNVALFPRYINVDVALVTLKTDSSQSGWGALNESNGECIQGQWSISDKEHHINYLELKLG